MKNPWTKKNPFMSMWLSAANKAAGSARGQATAAVKREANKAAASAASAGVDLVREYWANVLTPEPTPTAKPKPKPRTTRKPR